MRGLNTPSRLLQLPVGLLLSALAWGCSSNPPPGGTAPVDAGVDAEDDVKLFLGPGDVTITWTVNGGAPAQGCSAARGVNVELTSPDFNMTTLRIPCATGRHEFRQVMASDAQITARLLAADGTRIYDYVLPVQIRSGRQTTHNIDFSPPGRARVRWTINTTPASEGCTSVIADFVQAQRVGRVISQGACSAGALVLTGTFQPGPLTVNLLLGNSAERRALDSRMVTVEVPSGGTGEAMVDFQAAPRMMMR